MPTASLRPCATPQCGVLVPHGHCAAHQRRTERLRGSAHARGYTSYWHEVFRPFFISLLVNANVAPVCGASLPTGPQTTHSRCQADGLMTGSGLHLHHEPPLEEWERADRARVCDPHRIQLLCASCHHAQAPGGTRNV